MRVEVGVIHNSYVRNCEIQALNRFILKVMVINFFTTREKLEKRTQEI